VYRDMEWWKQIRLEVLRGETCKREILRREGIHFQFTFPPLSLRPLSNKCSG
jgi:hypothetical protein